MTGCDSSTSPPDTDALPLIVCAVTLLAVQLPTPDRGDESVPWTVVGSPLPVRFPFVPTFPECVATAGSPPTSGFRVVAVGGRSASERERLTAEAVANAA